MFNLRGRLKQSVKGDIILTPGCQAPTPKAYEGYGAPSTNQIVDSEKILLILPENMLHMVHFGKRIKKGIWWLSVDNALMAIARLGSIPPLRLGVFHFYQSDYARQFLDRLHRQRTPHGNWRPAQSHVAEDQPRSDGGRRGARFDPDD